MGKNKAKKALSWMTLASMVVSTPGRADTTPVAVNNDIEVGNFTMKYQDTLQRQYIKVPNVIGGFTFSQDVLSPSEDVFNIYGTVVTGMCAKPFPEGTEAVDTDEAGTYYINVGGNMEYSTTITLDDLKDKTQNKICSCSCSTSRKVMQVQVSGIPLTDVLELADLPDTEVNTLSVTAQDGFKVSMPLSYALDHEAMLVYQVNGQELEANGRAQLWMPGAVAKYFARNVVEIELTNEETVPEVIKVDEDLRAKVSIVNKAGDAAFVKGQDITIEGYADDRDSAITAVEFSMDGGETWTICDTMDTTTDRWVYWQFTFTAGDAGDYEIMARARTADGTVSPLASSLQFTVMG